MRKIDNVITELKPNEVFVFGSNEIGKHGKGAAKTALKWGAKWGQGVGLMGKTYGIPTKGNDMSKSLTLKRIEKYVYQFIDFAKTRPDLMFLVTEIGCGLAGYKPYDIAYMFNDAMDMDNVYLPESFIKLLSK